MKNIAILAAAAAVMMSGSAFAAPVVQPIDVNASVTAQCGVSSSAQSVTIGSIAARTGFARTDVGAMIESALAGLTVEAWCTGVNNGVVLTRTPLVNAAATSGLVVNGFANGVVYDLAVNIAGATRIADSWDVATNGLEGTSDGTLGPVNVSSFGPTGVGGSLVTFRSEPLSPVSGAITVNNGTGATAGFGVNNGIRLAAGPSYTSQITLTLTPGV